MLQHFFETTFILFFAFHTECTSIVELLSAYFAFVEDDHSYMYNNKFHLTTLTLFNANFNMIYSKLHHLFFSRTP